MNTVNKPIDTIRDGRLKATIWSNPKKNGVFYTVELSRSYQDDQEKWHNSYSFSGIDPLRIARLSERAYDRIMELRSFDNTGAAQ